MTISIDVTTLRFVQAIILVSIIYVTLSYCQVPDNSPTPQPTISAAEARQNEIIRELERQKRIIELERDLAKTQKEIRESGPDVKSKTNTGALTLSDDDIARDIIVYRELSKVNDSIAASLRGTIPVGSTLAIYDSASFADWTFYRRSLPLFKIVIQDLTDDYCLIATSSKPPTKAVGASSVGFASSLASAGNVIGQFADLVSYFKTETTMTGKTVTISEDALVADLFSNLRSTSTFVLLYPKSFAIDSPVLCGEAKTVKSCCTPGDTADCSETRPVYCSEVANALDGLYRARRAAFAAKEDSLELKKLEKYFEEFIRLISDSSPANAESALKRYVNAEQLEALQRLENIYYIEIKALKAVGTTRIRKNIFFLSDKLDYSGGVVVQWTLFAKDGRVINSGIESSFDGFVPPKDLRTQTP